MADGPWWTNMLSGLIGALLGAGVTRYLSDRRADLEALKTAYVEWAAAVLDPVFFFTSYQTSEKEQAVSRLQRAELKIRLVDPDAENRARVKGITDDLVNGDYRKRAEAMDRFEPLVDDCRRRWSRFDL
jgi:hypothetical protein